MAQKKAKTHEFTIQLRTWSNGSVRASLGFAVNCEHLPQEIASELFRGAHLQVSLSCDPAGQKDIPGQERLTDTTKTVDFEADVTQFGTAQSTYTAAFKLRFVDAPWKELVPFAGKTVVATCVRLGDAATSEESEE